MSVFFTLQPANVRLVCFRFICSRFVEVIYLMELIDLVESYKSARNSYLQIENLFTGKLVIEYNYILAFPM